MIFSSSTKYCDTHVFRSTLITCISAYNLLAIRITFWCNDLFSYFCRLLEADQKSAKSLSVNGSGHSRKGSISSQVSTTSVGSHVSNLNYDYDPGKNSIILTSPFFPECDQSSFLSKKSYPSKSQSVIFSC